VTRLGWSFLFLAGCRACTMSDGETTYEHIDKPVRVSVVRQATGSTQMVISNVGFVLRVETSPPFDEPLAECLVSKYGIGEDPTGKLVAFRCDMDGETWHMLRLAAGTHVNDCDADLGPARKPDFTKAQPIADAAVPILACHEEQRGTMHRPLPEVYGAIAAQLREAGGAAAVTAFFSKTNDRARPPLADEEEDPWLASVSALPTAEQTTIDADLCPALLDPTKTNAYVRAARRCPLRDPAVVAAALARSRTDLAATDPGWTGKWPKPLAWSLPIASAGDPKATKALACAFVKSSPDGDSRRSLAAAACPTLAGCDGHTWDLEERTDAGIRVRAPNPCL
jgi:hypothetical protein